MDSTLDVPSASTVTFSTGLSAWGDRGEFAVDVSGDSPLTGSRTYNVSLDVSAQNAFGDTRVELRAVDHTGCVVDATSSTFAVTGTGIKTTALTLNFNSSSESLWLAVQMRFTGTHGDPDKSITIRTHDADSWVEAPWPARVMTIS
jgi:hypothetical protein